MRIRLAVPEDHVEPDVINAALEAVTRLDEHMILSGQSPTSHELLAQGAIWHPEPPGDEHFDHGATIASRGHGDCDDWAPLHAATMRTSGQDPGATAVVIPSGPSTWHAVVQTSEGRILKGDDDISVQAGMPMPKSIVGSLGEDIMQVFACDPHYGRIYRGSLAPTVGPLAIHCGPQVAVRGIDIAGYGRCFQGRCDIPIVGSPLVAMRHRRQRRGRHHVVGGNVPYALSCTSLMGNPYEAVEQAIVGAIMAGDAAEMVPHIDRYKLLAMQMGMQGKDPATVRQAVEEAIAHDLEAAEALTGIPGHAHVEQLKAQLAAHGVEITSVHGGYFIDGGYVVSGFNIGDIAKIASGVVHTVAPVVNKVAHMAGDLVHSPIWGDIVHGVQAAVSVVPGLGTAVSEIIATAETAINAVDAVLSGSPLKFAIHAAYNYALASIPGAAAIRIVLDPYVEHILQFALKKALIDSGELDKLLNSVPDKPKVGKVSPRSILASLAHILVGHLGMKNTSGKPTSKPAPTLLHSPPAMHAPSPHPPAPPVMAPPPVIKPPGVPHAAVHVEAPKPVPAPPKGQAPVAHSSVTIPAPHPTENVTVHLPGASMHWHCAPGAGGVWQCSWVASVSGIAAPTGQRKGKPTAAEKARIRKSHEAFFARHHPDMKPHYADAASQQASAPSDGSAPSPQASQASAKAPAGASPGASPSGGGGGDDGGGGGGAPAPAYDPGPAPAPYEPPPEPDDDMPEGVAQ